VPEDVKVLRARGAHALEDAAVHEIRSFVNQGGVLVTTPDFAEMDRHGRFAVGAGNGTGASGHRTW